MASMGADLNQAGRRERKKAVTRALILEAAQSCSSIAASML